jgi:hypothetical protein
MYCKRNFDWEEPSLRAILHKTGEVRYTEIMVCAKAHTFMILISFVAERKQCLWFCYRSHIVWNIGAELVLTSYDASQRRNLLRANVGNRGRCYCAYVVLYIMSEYVRVNVLDLQFLVRPGCCATSLGDWYSKFWDSLMISSSGIKVPMKKVF